MRICFRYCTSLFRKHFVTSASCPSLYYKYVASLDANLPIRFIGSKFQRPDPMSRFGDGWQKFDNFMVYAWSISGLETCIVVKSDDILLAFDMGYAIPQSVSCGHVFITHGHMDHIGAVSNHAAKRGLMRLRKAKYYAPPYLVDSLKTITNASFVMAPTTEALEDVNIVPFGLEDTVQISSNYFLRAFPTVHRIPSQGYILYRQVKKLKAEYVGQPSANIAELIRNQVSVHDVWDIPEVAYTGDTTIEAFLNLTNPDVLRVGLLIMEATILDHSDKQDNIQKVKDTGHTHLDEISQNAALFKDVKNILLMHFSTKYSVESVNQHVFSNLAPQLQGKIHVATIAKEHLS